MSGVVMYHAFDRLVRGGWTAGHRTAIIAVDTGEECYLRWVRAFVLSMMPVHHISYAMHVCVDVIFVMVFERAAIFWVYILL